MTSIVLKTYEFGTETSFHKKVIIGEIGRMKADPKDKFIRSYWARRLFFGGNDKDDSGLDLLLDNGILVIVAECPCGVAGISVVNTNSGSIELLLVSEGYRGAGIGKRLFAESIKNGGYKLEVHVDNSLAVTMYKRYGFKIYDSSGEYLRMRIKKNK